MKLVYHLSDGGRRRIFVETGRDPGQVQELEVDPVQLSADDRRLLVEINPLMQDKAQLKLRKWVGMGYTERPHLILEAPQADPVQLLAIYRDARESNEAVYAEAREEAITKEITKYTAWSSDREPNYETFSQFTGSPRLDELKAAHAAAKEQAKALSSQKMRDLAAEETRLAAEKAARLAERARWAAEHGSPRLRKCVEQEYDCQRLYVLERATLEHPGYTVDFDDAARWKVRGGPSEAALDEAARIGGEVVWLTRYPVNDGAPEDYQGEWEEEREAVVISNYLGKYDLIKVL